MDRAISSTELHDAVTRLCRRLGPRHVTDDLVQETYARALASARRFQGRGSPEGWILTIARCVCVDHARSAGREARFRTRSWTPSERLVHDEAEGSVSTVQMLGQIEPTRREAFVLTQLMGLGYAEVAERFDCPIGTIRSRVARARQELAGLV